MGLIFNTELMEKHMKEFEIDLKQMPLGKISSNQIKKAFSVLIELDNVKKKLFFFSTFLNSKLKSKKLIRLNVPKTLLSDASNRFYSIIPHNFGFNPVPLIDNIETIQVYN